MKGKNWREYEPPKRRRRRRRKGGLLRKLCFALVLFLVGYVGFLVYYNFGKPYTVALDAGHGGADVGAEGVSMATQATAAVPMVLSAILRLPAMKIMKKALPLQRFWRRKCKI